MDTYAMVRLWQLSPVAMTCASDMSEPKFAHQPDCQLLVV